MANKPGYLVTPVKKSSEARRGTINKMISVPKGVAEQMRSFQDEYYVNWSAIATEAFVAAMKAAKESSS